MKTRGKATSAGLIVLLIAIALWLQNEPPAEEPAQSTPSTNHSDGILLLFP